MHEIGIVDAKIEILVKIGLDAKNEILVKIGLDAKTGIGGW